MIVYTCGIINIREDCYAKKDVLVREKCTKQVDEIIKSFYYCNCLDDNDDTLDHVKCGTKAPISLTSHTHRTLSHASSRKIGCGEYSRINHILRLRTSMSSRTFWITTRIHLCFLNYISGLTNDRYIYFSDATCSMPRYILPSERSSAISRASPQILARYFSRYFHRVLHHSLLHSPSVRFNYTRQFVMLIHNYTLCTIAVRSPFRPTLP